MIMIYNYLFNQIFRVKFKSRFQLLLLSIVVFTFSNSLYSQTCNVNAGNSRTICATETLTLGGSFSINEATTSNPVWTQIAGPSVIINNPNNETTTVSGYVGGNSYTFRLSGTCNDSSGVNFQDVTITVNPITVAEAGPSLAGCPGDYNLSANAAGTNETGAWTLVSGPSLTINTSSSPTTSITLPSNQAGISVLRWTITNANGCTSSDTVNVTNYGGEIVVDAGSDQQAFIDVSECYTTTQSVTLSASQGGNGTGGFIISVAS